MDTSSIADQISVLKDIQLVNYVNVVAVTILVYDYCITFSREIVHIWGHSFSAISLLFLFTRYLPFADSAILLIHTNLPNPSVHLYSALFKTQVWSVTIGISIAAVVLLLRTCAIYTNRRKIIIFLSLLYVIMIVVAFYYVQVILTSLQFEQSSSSALARGIFISQANHGIFVGYASLMAFETLVLIMTILKAKSQRNESRLYQTLYRDSLSVYTYIFVISLCNMLLQVFAPSEAKLLLVQFHRVTYSIFLGRIILNIRGAMAGQARHGFRSTDNSSEGGQRTDHSDRSTLLLGDSLGDIHQVVLDIYLMEPDVSGFSEESESERASGGRRDEFELGETDGSRRAWSRR